MPDSAPPPERNGRTTRLSRDVVLDTALSIADTQGLERLTFRRLADALGVTPMALYRHVENKQDLLLSLLEHVIARYRVTDHTSGHWRDWTVTAVVRMRDALVRHPGILPLLGTIASAGPAALAVTDRVLGELTRAGLDIETAARTFYALISYMIGSVTLETGARLHQRQFGNEGEGWQEIGTQALLTLPLDQYPNLVAAAPSLAVLPDRAQFEAGLRAILDGIAPTP